MKMIWVVEEWLEMMRVIGSVSVSAKEIEKAPLVSHYCCKGIKRLERF